MNSNFRARQQWTRIISRQRGIATIEIALLLPVLLLMLWLGAELLHYVQFQHRLHRSTAAIADTLINGYRIDPNRDSSYHVAYATHGINGALGHMLVDYDASGKNFGPAKGWRLSYIVSNPGVEPTVMRMNGGIACGSSGAPTVAAIVASGLRPDNPLRLEWLLLEICAKPTARWLPTAWRFPLEMSSYFIAVRR